MASAPKKAKTDGIAMAVAEDRLLAGESITDFRWNKKRVKILRGNDGDLTRECKGVLYWMWRDRRVQDNWALLYSQKMAIDLNVPLQVMLCLPEKLGEMTIRHYTFLIEGLKEVEEECKELNIGFRVELGEPNKLINKSYLDSNNIGLVVADFSPLRYHKKWLADLMKSTEVPIHQVDAHNIVPIWSASNKQEYGARTIRPKITNQLPEFLTGFPPVIPHPVDSSNKFPGVNYSKLYAGLDVDVKGFGVEPVDTFKPGTKAGLQNLEEFVSKRFKLYGAKRNDPTEAALSNLSPWVNNGQISMQRAVLYVKKKGASNSESVKSFVEESVVRRELSDNFCHYNDKYDSLEGATDWARKTLNDHRKDKREYVYTTKELEEGLTHDDLWNSAQLQLVKEGKLHGFLRMYWAKKVLEWTASPEDALKEAQRLNDRYAVDGNDPNGFVGVMWSVAGIHDQGWAERPVFGKIRYMNYAGCKRKFDINKFIIKYGGKVHTKKK